MKRIFVIGGGAAGMMAAYQAAACPDTDVTIFERNPFAGKKLRITGKGRCNVTNDCTREAFLASVLSNPKFLYSAAARFTSADTMAFFASAGVPLKVERGNRVFPVSDKAGDVVGALERQLRRLNVEIIRGNCTKLLIGDRRCCGAVVIENSNPGVYRAMLH